MRRRYFNFRFNILILRTLLIGPCYFCGYWLLRALFGLTIFVGRILLPVAHLAGVGEGVVVWANNHAGAINRQIKKLEAWTDAAYDSVLAASRALSVRRDASLDKLEVS